MKTLRLLKDIYTASPGRICLEGISMLAEIVNSMLVRIILVKIILDKVIDGHFQEAITIVMLAALADMGLSVFESWMNHYYRKKDDIRLHKHFQGKLYRCAVYAKLSCYDSPEYYNRFLLAAKNSDVKAVQFLNSLKEGIVTTAEILLSGGLIVTNLNSLFWIVMIASTLYAIVSARSAKVRVALIKEQNPYEKKRDYVKRTFFLKKNAMDLRNQKIAKRMFQMFDKAYKEEMQAIDTFTKRRTLLGVVSGGVFYLQYTSIIVLLTYRALVIRDISVGDFSMLLNTALMLGNNWRFFGNLISELLEHRLFADQYYQFLDETEKEMEADERMSVPKDLKELEAQQVSFRYDECGKQVFDQISLRIKRGEKIALVGPNGAGKSTFVNLLLNLYEPQAGTLGCNGKDIRKFNQTEYRNSYSLIFQESNLYPCSIAENLLLRKPEGKSEEQRIWEVLDLVSLGDKIRRLPLGLQTPVTKEFDNEGVVFSGGESQRMALARAILQDASIFIMDEPSSALDPEMELQLNNLFTEVLKDKTLLLISHRISTITGVDYIYMIQNGKIEEQGTHQQLMDRNGHYAHIYRTQSNLYKI